MLRYNTQLRQLVLPEYGRNIQQMVDHCLTIEDRAERTRCAYSIVNAMGALYPALRDNEQSRHKLWDHLNIMSDFGLDIDWPCEVIGRESLNMRPDKVVYPQSLIHRRHYGRNIEMMIQRAAAMEPGEERDALAMMLANQMKKLLMMVNKDGVDDERIFRDLAEYSHGELRYDGRASAPSVSDRSASGSGQKEKEEMITRGMLTPAGEFNKPHGIKGEISASFDPRVDVGALKCVVAEVNGLFVPFFIDAIRSRGADAVLLTIDGITDENEAKLLSRKPLYLLNGDAALAADDEDDGFYAEDLVGFSALDEDGAVIGKIAGVDSTTANVLFVIDRPDGSEALVPVADEFIDGIDPESATITLRLPDGLL